MQSPFLSSLRVGLWLLCAWPLLAQAGPADEFAAATRAQQAKLLQAWAAEPDAARLPLLQGLHPKAVVYDCMDELSAFRGAPPATVTKLGQKPSTQE